MAAEQLLLDAQPEVDVSKLPLPDRWEHFKRANPGLLLVLADCARQLRARGVRVSINRVFEECRERVLTVGDEWRLNNSFRAFAARDLHETYPDLDGVFETRRSKADRR